MAAFDEGGVPWSVLEELFRTTNALVNAIKLRKDAPVAEIDAVGVAFRECYTLWCDTHSPPRMARKTYLKQLFAGRNAVFAELKRLHAAYVRSVAAKGRKSRTLSAADALRDEDGTDERRRIFAEIDRLRRKGMSVAKAISAMMHGSYAARMRGRKAATWARYYKDHASRRTGRAPMQDAAPVCAAAGTDFVVPPATTTKTATQTTTQTATQTTTQTTAQRILAAIRINPNATRITLAKEIGISAEGIKWHLHRMKDRKIIRRIGPKNGGHWDVL